jgi:hypothetical protein
MPDAWNVGTRINLVSRLKEASRYARQRQFCIFDRVNDQSDIWDLECLISTVPKEAFRQSLLGRVLTQLFIDYFHGSCLETRRMTHLELI